MLRWIAGLHDVCWEEAIEIERKRTKKRNATRRRRAQGQIAPPSRDQDHQEKALQKKFDRAKLLVNVGEYSQAMASLLSNGTAPINEAILLQLSAKHPKRSKPVCWPDPYETSDPPTGRHRPIVPTGTQPNLVIPSTHRGMEIDRHKEKAHPEMDIDIDEEKDP